MPNTLTIPTTITWNKLTTRPLTAEEKEEYDQMYGTDQHLMTNNLFSYMLKAGILLKLTNGSMTATAVLHLIPTMTSTPFIGQNSPNHLNPFRKET